MTQSTFAEFVSLHRAASPLILPNVWDAASTVLFQAAGARAVATSSAALAWSLGYADGGALPRTELLNAIHRIARVARVPLTVDIEDGYSDDPLEVAHLVVQIAQCGAIGINIEDGVGTADLLCSKIAAVRKVLAGQPLFINARTDVYLRGLESGAAAVALTMDRLTEYHRAGAEGAFVPGMTALDEVAQVVAYVSMPLNLMIVPGIATVPELFSAGVKRISVGPALFQAAYGLSVELVHGLVKRGDTSALFARSLSYDMMNAEFSNP